MTYVVQCFMDSSRGQSVHLPPTYVVRGQGKVFGAESIPAGVAINRVCCQHYELTNQRCTDPRCKHRPASSMSDPNSEAGQSC